MRMFRNRATKIRAQGSARRRVKKAKSVLTRAKNALKAVNSRRVSCIRPRKKR